MDSTKKLKNSSSINYKYDLGNDIAGWFWAWNHQRTLGIKLTKYECLVKKKVTLFSKPLVNHELIESSSAN